MKKVIYILLVIISIVVLYFGISTMVFFSSAKDKKNVVLDGYVYDSQTREPISGVLVNVHNSTYKKKGSDYTDYSSYLGNETIELETDLKGHFFVRLERSAFLEITFSKEGYLKEIEHNYAEKKIQKEIYLNKNRSR